MNTATLIGLFADVLLILFSLPGLAIACVSASGVLGACVAWSCGGLGAATTAPLCAALFG